MTPIIVRKGFSQLHLSLLIDATSPPLPSPTTSLRHAKTPAHRFDELGLSGAPEGIRTPNLLIRSQMLYPLSYGRILSLSEER